MQMINDIFSQIIDDSFIMRNEKKETLIAIVLFPSSIYYIFGFPYLGSLHITRVTIVVGVQISLREKAITYVNEAKFASPHMLGHVCSLF